MAIFTLLAAALALQAQGQPVVRASISPNAIVVGETATWRVRVELDDGGEPEFILPEMPEGLNVVGTQQSSQVSFGLGRTRSAVLTREYVLLGTRAGEYRVPSMEIRIGQKRIRTLALRLVVGGSAPAGSAAASGDATLSVQLDPEVVYVGEQATLTGDLLLSPDIQLRLTRPPSYDAPAPSDFWVVELPPAREAEARIIDGRRFVSQRFFRAYFPLQDGRFAFGPAKVTFEAREGFLFSPRTIELRAASPPLTVRPLPLEGQPPDFRGAVGRLEIRQRVEPARAIAGEAVTLVVELNGEANVKALPIPTLPELPDVDVLPPDEQASIALAGRRVAGTKTFSWVLIPQRAGRLVIPPVRYPVFDPQRRAYVVLETDTLRIDVAGGDSVSPGTRLAALRRASATPRWEWALRPGFAAFQLVPVALLALLFVTRSQMRRRRQPTPKSIVRALRPRLAAPDFLESAEQALLDLARLRGHANASAAWSPDRLQQALAASETPSLAQSAGELLRDLRAARYAPAAPDSAARSTLLARLEALARALGRRRRVPHGVALIALICAQAAHAQTPFTSGVEAFDAGRFDLAVPAFEEAVKRAPADASAWYNLGNAYYEGGRVGSATRAWLRAVKLQPRASDAAANLRATGSEGLLRRVRPLTQLTAVETFVIGTVLWWTCILLAGLALFTRRRRAFAFGALAALTLCGFLIAAWAVERALPAAAIVLDGGARTLDAPALHAELRGVLEPGTGVIVLEQKDEWSRVRLRNGSVVWIANDEIGAI